MNNISCDDCDQRIRMGRNGRLTLQKKVKTSYPETAFVIVSGYADFFLCKRGVTVSCK